MNSHLPIPLLTLPLIAPLLAEPAHAGSAGADPIPVVAAGELRSRYDASLGSLRAGDVAGSPAVSAGERDSLLLAESRSPELADLRAGAISENEWTYILLGAVIVLIIVIVA